MQFTTFLRCYKTNIPNSGSQQPGSWSEEQGAGLQPSHDGQVAKVRNPSLHLLPLDGALLVISNTTHRPLNSSAVLSTPLSRANIAAKVSQFQVHHFYLAFLFPLGIPQSFTNLVFCIQAIMFWRIHLAECR